MTDFNWGAYKTGVTNPYTLIEGLQYRVFLGTGTLSYNGVVKTNNSTFIAIDGLLTRSSVVITGNATYEVDATVTCFVNNLYSLGDTNGNGRIDNPYKTLEKAKNIMVSSLGVINKCIIASGVYNEALTTGYYTSIALNYFGVDKHTTIIDLLSNTNGFGGDAYNARTSMNNVTLKNLTLFTNGYNEGQQGTSVIHNNCIFINVLPPGYTYTVKKSLFINCGSIANNWIVQDIVINNTNIESCTFFNSFLKIAKTYTILYPNTNNFKALIFDSCTINVTAKTQLKYSVIKNCSVKFGARSSVLYDNTNPLDADIGKGYARLQREHYLAFPDETVHLEGCIVEDSTDNLFVDKINGNYAIKSTHIAAIMNSGKPIGGYKVGTALKPVTNFNVIAVNVTQVADTSIKLTSTASAGSVDSIIEDLGNLYGGLVYSPLGDEMLINGEQFTYNSDLGLPISEGPTALEIGSMYQVNDNNLPIFVEKGVDTSVIAVGIKYVVRAAAGEYITYNSNNYGNGVVFVGLAGITTYTESGNCLVYEIIQYEAHQQFKAVYTNFYNFAGNSVQVVELLRIVNTRTFRKKSSRTDPTLTGENWHEFKYFEPCTIDASGKGNAESGFDESTAELLRCRYRQIEAKISVNCRKP